MSVLVILIVLSFAFYLFYKTKYIRSNRPVEKKWLAAKSNIALGMFICLFGINSLFVSQTTITYIVGAIFIIYGGAFTWVGFKKYKHYHPFAIEEAAINDRQK
ncbi:MAG TPA: YtpI family protein [Neobacillus sp.]